MYTSKSADSYFHLGIKILAKWICFVRVWLSISSYGTTVMVAFLLEIKWDTKKDTKSVHCVYTAKFCLVILKIYFKWPKKELCQFSHNVQKYRPVKAVMADSNNIMGQMTEMTLKKIQIQGPQKCSASHSLPTPDTKHDEQDTD